MFHTTGIDIFLLYVTYQVISHLFPLMQVVPNNRKLSAKQKAASDELELEGWKLVRPDPKVWNSMGLSEKAEKRSYLKALLAEENDTKAASSQTL